MNFILGCLALSALAGAVVFLWLGLFCFIDEQIFDCKISRALKDRFDKFVNKQ